MSRRQLTFYVTVEADTRINDHDVMDDVRTGIEDIAGRDTVTEIFPLSDNQIEALQGVE